MKPAPFPRILGALTAAYGAYTFARPHSLMRIAGLEPPDLPVSQQRKALGRAIGARDLASGASMMLTPAGMAMQGAIMARVACDLGDAIGFGLAVPPQFRFRVVAVAAGWGLLCAAAFPSAGRAR